MDTPAMQRSAKSCVDQAAKEERELQALVYGAPSRRPAGQALYPKLRTNSEWRSATITRREPRQATQQKPTIASVLYPNLRTEKGK